MTTDPVLDRIIELRGEVVNGKLTWQQVAQSVGLESGNAARKRYQRWARQQDGNGQEQSTQIDSPVIIGVTADDYYPTEADLEAVWRNLIAAQDRIFELNRKRREEQKIILPVPCAIAQLSDLHLGDPGTDYRAIRDDAQIIRDTPGLYAGFSGDGVNNWIVNKLAGLQRKEVVDFDTEWYLFLSWLDWLKGKLLYVVSGNHDNWSIKLAGIDRVREALRGTKTLYHKDEIRFKLQAGPVEYRVKVRHQWRGHSLFNVTHAIEVGWERGPNSFDIGIGGHVHRGTFCRSFDRHSIRRWAVLVGTYKVEDDYQEEQGFTRGPGRGCGAMVFNRGGEFEFVEDLGKAADWLDYLRTKDKGKSYNIK